MAALCIRHLRSLTQSFLVDFSLCYAKMLDVFLAIRLFEGIGCLSGSSPRVLQLSR